MITSNAILIAATLVILGLLGFLGLCAYLGFRFVTTVAILKAAPDARSATAMLRATGESVTQKDPEKIPMEMPATGIDELVNSPEAIKKLRKKQNPTPDPY